MSSPASATHPLAGHAGAHAHPDMDATYRKITWRLIPFLVFLFVLAWIDRVNVGFAKLQMLDDLKFSEAVYGLGADAANPSATTSAADTAGTTVDQDRITNLRLQFSDHGLVGCKTRARNRSSLHEIDAFRQF